MKKMPKNKRVMADVFGKRTITTSEPDGAWPMTSELIGVEIEVENLRGDPGSAYPEWTVHEDHSLRNGVEFVTNGPVGGKALTRAIRKFFAAGFKYDMTPRTSVHVHVNASDSGMTMDQFRNLFCIMYLIEPAVFRWADENRKWCGYCSPLTDLDPHRVVSILSENKNEQRFVQAIRGTGNNDRYYGLNVSSFHKHGTLEFRYFPCTDNEATLTSWVKFVMHVKAAAGQFDGPVELLGSLSTRARLQDFLQTHFGTVATTLAGHLDFDDCLGRVRDLLGMLDLTPEQVKAGESYKTHRSKGLTKLLAVTFPTFVVKDHTETLAEAQRAADRAHEVFSAALIERGITHARLIELQTDYHNATAHLRAVQSRAPELAQLHNANAVARMYIRPRAR